MQNAECRMQTSKRSHSAFCILHSAFAPPRRCSVTPALMKYLIWPLVKFLVAFIIVQVIVAAMNWIERRLLGLVQARPGPNRVGPKGPLPIIAQPGKCLLKEDIVPANAETIAYFLGPILPLIPTFLVYCVIP